MNPNQVVFGWLDKQYTTLFLEDSEIGGFVVSYVPVSWVDLLLDSATVLPRANDEVVNQGFALAVGLFVWAL